MNNKPCQHIYFTYADEIVYYIDTAKHKGTYAAYHKDKIIQTWYYI
jgi:hypothetical protein